MRISQVKLHRMDTGETMLSFASAAADSYTALPALLLGAWGPWICALGMNRKRQ